MKTVNQIVFKTIILGMFILALSCEKDKEKPEDNGIKDADGNVYTSVVIGDQEWLVENLKTTKYADGSPIDFPGSDTLLWQTHTTGAYAWLNSDEAFKNVYGALYNWYAVTDSRGICPAGWRVSTSQDWQNMITFLNATYGWTNDAADFNGIANKLKSCRMKNSSLGGECATDVHPRWNNHGSHIGNNELGFSALPGGSRISGRFSGMGAYGFWWVSDLTSGGLTNRISINYDQGRVFISSNFPQFVGYSVRCIKE